MTERTRSDASSEPSSGAADGDETPDSLSRFYRLTLAERRAAVGERVGLSAAELRVLSGVDGLTDEHADHMVENAVGTVSLPLGICVHLQVDGCERLIPMAIEEPSVVAAASHAAKLLRAGGGVRTTVQPSHMVGQIQLVDVPDCRAAAAAVHEARERLLAAANRCDPDLIARGGGARDLEVRELPAAGPDDPHGPMLVVHLIVDVSDAMGANAVNTMCERLAPQVERLTSGHALLKIVSNLADRRLVLAEGQVPFFALQGKGANGPAELAQRIEQASVFAERDPHRAATHNKGIMNGIDAVLLAFGQDWRAVEAGAHAFAARQGRYGALSRWRVQGETLVGRLELPVPVGVVGGITQVHPLGPVVRRIAEIRTAADLASVVAAVGLAQNLGALRALAAEGIQRGHMRIHARNVATAAGAQGDEVDEVAAAIAANGPDGVKLDAARAALRRLRG